MAITETPQSKHTPGPWHVIPAYASAPAGVQNNDGQIIADIYSTDDNGEEYNSAHANAALIAAAPEMLSALKRLLSECPEISMSTKFQMAVAQEKAEVAIARAEGRQP